MIGRRKILCICMGAVLGIPISGCGLRNGESVPVRGTVLYRGTPLHGGIIVFVPDASRGSSGPLARGQIQADGSYSLETGDARGARGGWYRVTVAAVEIPRTGNWDKAVPQSLLPDKYRDPELSGLCCEVRTGRANRINFDLE